MKLLMGIKRLKMMEKTIEVFFSIKDFLILKHKIGIFASGQMCNRGYEFVWGPEYSQHF